MKNPWRMALVVAFGLLGILSLIIAIETGGWYRYFTALMAGLVIVGLLGIGGYLVTTLGMAYLGLAVAVSTLQTLSAYFGWKNGGEFSELVRPGFFLVVYAAGFCTLYAGWLKRKPDEAAIVEEQDG